MGTAITQMLAFLVSLLLISFVAIQTTAATAIIENFIYIVGR